MTDHLPDRAEQAARDWFAEQAAAPVPTAGRSAPPAAANLPSISPDAVRVAFDRRQRRRFTGLLAAAAVLVAALVITPMALRPGDPPITGIPAPSDEPAWATTAPPPLSPRSGSLTAWLDGQFYIIGGWSGSPCPPGSQCDMAPPDLRDGARYDPATDIWTPIAEAPLGVGVLASNRGYFTMAATSDSIVVASLSDRRAWSYRAATDSWQQLADTPVGGQLVATSTTAVLSTYWDSDPARYAYTDDAWTPLPTGPLDSCPYWQTLADSNRILAIAGCGEDEVEVRTSSLDPATGEWSDPAAVPGTTAEEAAGYVGGVPVLVDGKLVWPNWLSVFSSVRGRGIYDLETQTWRDISPDAVLGGLSFRGMQAEVIHPVFEAHSLVEANGHLLDVRDASWREVPEAPVPDRWDPVVAVGPDSLLSCFGYLYVRDSTRGDFANGCHLLTVGPATTRPPMPTGTPLDPEPLGRGWEKVAELSDEMIDPLLVSAGDAFYLMGGYSQDESGDVTQSTLVGRFDPQSWEFATLAPLPYVSLSQPYSLAADVVGSTIYVHLSFEERGELWAYDTRADSWSKVDDTDETQRFVGNADGLFRTRSVEPDDPFVLERLDGSTWTPVETSGPAPATADGAVVVLDDHQLAWVTPESISLLNTQNMLFQKPFRPAESSLTGIQPDVAGGAGSLVLVYKTNRDSATPAAMEVFTFALGGEWQQRTAPAEAGGLNWFAPGPSAGRWVVVHGNLLDPATGEWQLVPELADGSEPPVAVAGLTGGLLACLSKAPTTGGAAGCWFYYTAG